MNLRLKEVFRGKVVNKAHTIDTGVHEFPRYVLEYLIDNYCSAETFREDMDKVVRRLKENFVHGADLDAFAAALRLTDVPFNLVAGGALASAFIPAFTGFLTHDDQAGAWRR